MDTNSGLYDSYDKPDNSEEKEHYLVYKIKSYKVKKVRQHVNQKVWVKWKRIRACLCIDVHHGDRLDVFRQEVIIKLRPLEGADYEAVSVEQSQNVCPYFSSSRRAAGIQLKRNDIYRNFTFIQQ